MTQLLRSSGRWSFSLRLAICQSVLPKELRRQALLFAKQAEQ